MLRTPDLFPGLITCCQQVSSQTLPQTPDPRLDLKESTSFCPRLTRLPESPAIDPASVSDAESCLSHSVLVCMVTDPCLSSTLRTCLSHSVLVCMVTDLCLSSTLSFCLSHSVLVCLVTDPCLSSTLSSCLFHSVLVCLVTGPCLSPDAKSCLSYTVLHCASSLVTEPCLSPDAKSCLSYTVLYAVFFAWYLILFLVLVVESCLIYAVFFVWYLTSCPSSTTRVCLKSPLRVLLNASARLCVNQACITSSSKDCVRTCLYISCVAQSVQCPFTDPAVAGSTPAQATAFSPFDLCGSKFWTLPVCHNLRSVLLQSLLPRVKPLLKPQLLP